MGFKNEILKCWQQVHRSSGPWPPPERWRGRNKADQRSCMREVMAAAWFLLCDGNVYCLFSLVHHYLLCPHDHASFVHCLFHWAPRLNALLNHAPSLFCWVLASHGPISCVMYSFMHPLHFLIIPHIPYMIPANLPREFLPSIHHSKIIKSSK